MRPKIDRPDTDAIQGHFDQQISLLTDKQDVKHGKMLKKLFLDLYLSLIDMNHDITYSDWAGHVMVAVTKFGKLVMKMDLMKPVFELIYSFYGGYPGSITSKSILDKYRLKAKSKKVTYKDLVDISQDFSYTWGDLNQCFDYYRTALPLESVVLQIDSYHVTPRDPNQPPPIRLRHSGTHESTTVYMVYKLWHSARLTYYRLKYYGIPTFDYDVVFQNKNPPFKDYVFVDLLGRFESHCGWLPLSQGKFSKENLAKNPGRKHLTGLLEHYDRELEGLGVFPSCWQIDTRFSQEYAEKGVTDKVIDPFVVAPGKIAVGGQDPITDPVKELKKLGTLALLQPAVLEFLAQGLHRHRVLEKSLFLEIAMFEHVGDMSRVHCDEALKKEVVKGIYDKDRFLKLITNNFYLLSHVKNKKVTGIKDLPFPEDIALMQDAREFFFFKWLLGSKTGELMGGLFVQSCIDYADKFDPICKPVKNEHWVSWKVHTEAVEVVINDERLFAYEPQKEDTAVTIAGATYKVTLSGTVCYAYNISGEPLFTQAKYCEKAPTNFMTMEIYKTIQSAIYRDENSRVSLPVLSLTEPFGRDVKLHWRGYELHRVDLRYWHDKLGHVNIKGLKKFIHIVQGMPPYFWPESIKCMLCTQDIGDIPPDGMGDK